MEIKIDYDIGSCVAAITTPQALIDNTETIHNGDNASDLQVTKQTKKGPFCIFSSLSQVLDTRQARLRLESTQKVYRLWEGIELLGEFSKIKHLSTTIINRSNYVL